MPVWEKTSRIKSSLLYGVPDAAFIIPILHAAGLPIGDLDFTSCEAQHFLFLVPKKGTDIGYTMPAGEPLDLVAVEIRHSVIKTRAVCNYRVYSCQMS